MAVETGVNRLLEVSNARDDAAPDALGGDLGEEALDEIEPGCTRWREVQLEARMLGELRLRRASCASVVVEHEMEVEVLLHAPVDRLQEADELFDTVARLAFSNDETTLRVEGCEQHRCALALVVVSHRCRDALLQGEARLGAVERLDLAFPVDAQYQGHGPAGSCRPDDIGHFLLELQVVGNLQPTRQARPEGGVSPDALHAGVADPDRLRHDCKRQCVALAPA